MDWVAKALCHGYHIDLWYPPIEVKNPNDYYSISKAICNQCTVWDYCLELALKDKDKERWGCWGGTTPQERKSPSKVLHGTRERYRLGCECTECFDAEAQDKPIIDMGKVPKNGQQYDISNLLFQLGS